ncbi:hypothetical protein uan_030 [Pseudomonas phage UAntarctica]|nr:hypothetical protein uan_030 [Pseudomonas phage UAntarctica]
MSYLKKELEGSDTLIGRLAEMTLGLKVGRNIDLVVEAIDLISAVKDTELTPEGLAIKYRLDDDWGHHPLHTRVLWRHCVAESDTVSGYWEWVHHKITTEDEPE